MTNKDNQKFIIPMEVSKEAVEALGLKKEQIVTAKLGFKKVPVVYVECEKKVYDTYMRSLWAEEQQEYRNKKCIITSEKLVSLLDAKVTVLLAICMKAICQALYHLIIYWMMRISNLILKTKV